MHMLTLACLPIAIAKTRLHNYCNRKNLAIENPIYGLLVPIVAYSVQYNNYSVLNIIPQPLLALRTVKVLLELSPHTHTSTPARVTRLTALALYSDLLLFFGAPSEPQLTELEAVASTYMYMYMYVELYLSVMCVYSIAVRLN